MEESEQPPSLGASLHRLADTLLNTIRNRVELLAIEVEEEKHWLFSTVLWTTICLFCSFTSVLVITLTTVVLVPDEARGTVMIGFCLLYVAGTVIALSIVRRKLNRRAPPFADTVAELRKDIAYLKPPK